jgi:uncharacterized protein with HEPN domain
MREREVFVLLDEMLEACRNATFFITGMCEEEFLSDIRTQQAVAMSLVIIGEAAARLGRDHAVFLAKHADLPWRDVIAMRNRITHGYVTLDFRVIWRTVLSDIPQLLNRLEIIYREAGEEPGGASLEPPQD